MIMLWPFLTVLRVFIARLGGWVLKYGFPLILGLLGAAVWLYVAGLHSDVNTALEGQIKATKALTEYKASAARQLAAVERNRAVTESRLVEVMNAKEAIEHAPLSSPQCGVSPAVRSALSSLRKLQRKP